MVSFSGEEATNSGNMFREIQTEHMIYQINSSSDARKISDKMKKSAEEISKAVENARSISYEKKIATDELKISLSTKKDKMKKLRGELEIARKCVESATKKTSNLESEANKIRNAIEMIKNATQNLDPQYLEQSQNELTNSLVKITVESEKAQSDLNAAKKIEGITSKKLYEVETEVDKLEAHTLDKIRETERMIVNVSTTIEHIIKSYDEIAVVSKDLLKSATSVSVQFGETKDQGIEQNQGIIDAKVAI